jgi:hypothetical protein
MPSPSSGLLSPDSKDTHTICKEDNDARTAQKLLGEYKRNLPAMKMGIVFNSDILSPKISLAKVAYIRHLTNHEDYRNPLANCIFQRLVVCLTVKETKYFFMMSQSSIQASCLFCYWVHVFN